MIRWVKIGGLVFVLAILLMVILPGCAEKAPTQTATPTPTAKVINWRSQCEWPEGDRMYSEAHVHFCDLVKEKSGGRLIITPYSAAALCPAGKSHECCKEGTVELADTTGAYLVGTMPLGEISYGLPGSPLSSIEWHKVHYELGIRQLWEEATIKFLGLRYGCQTTVDPEGFLFRDTFTTLADLKGRKVRIAGGFKTKVVSEAMGMAPVMIARAEIPSALALGTVDGCATAFGSMYDCKYHESAPYLMEEPYMFNAGQVEYLINPDAYNALPDDLKKILDECLDEHALWSAEVYEPSRVKTAMEGFRADGVTFIKLPPEDVQLIRKYAVEKVWPEIAAKDTYSQQAITIITEYCKKLGYIK